MRARYVLLVAILLAAWWLRIAELDRYPTGLSADESIDVIDTLHISRSGIFPLYEDLGRPDPLHRMFTAGFAVGVGTSVWSVRMVSVFFGILTLPLMYWVTCLCLFHLPADQRQRASMLAAAVLAVAISHIVLSRGIYRGILQPPATLLAAGLLLRGLKTGRWRDFVLSGAALGVSFYTYTAVFVTPAAFAAAGAALLMFQRSTWRRWLPRLAVTGGVFVLCIIPLAARILNHPETVFGRAAQVGGTTGGVNLLAGVVPAAQQFFTRGDVNPQYNVASVPLLPPVFNVLFAIGLLVALRRLRQPSTWVMLTLLAVSVIPVILGREIPHGLRIVGAFAAFPVIVGFSAAYIPQRFQLLSVLAAVILTAVNIAYAYQTYTNYWAQSGMWRVYGRELQTADWFFRPDRRAFGDWVNAQTTPLLIPVDELATPTTRAWLLGAYPLVRAPDNTQSFPANTQVVIPWSLEQGDLRRSTRAFALLHNGVITLYPPLTADSHAGLVAGVNDWQTVASTDGIAPLLARTAPLPDGFLPLFETRHDAQVTFDSELRLVGWSGPLTLRAHAQTIMVTLHWVRLRPMGHNYTGVVQVLTQDYRQVAGHEDEILRWLMPSAIWTDSDVVPDIHPLTLPAGLTAGAYRLVASAYEYVYAPLNSFAADGTRYETLPTIGWLKVPQPAPPTLDGAPLDITFAGQFALRGASAATLNDGQVRLSLIWEALADRPAVDATLFVHLLDSSGTIVAQQDTRPWGGQYPTFIWDAGERVLTDFTFAADTPVGLSIAVGMYAYPDTTAFIVVQDGAPVSDNRARLGTLADLLRR